MKFFTIAVLLAGVSNLAEAWQLIAYEKDYSCNGGGRNRVDMPGTGCKECGNGNGGCVGAFTPRSVGLGGNDDCILYNQNDCQGNSVWNVRGQSPGCKSVGDVVRSYKCVVQVHASIHATAHGETQDVKRRKQQANPVKEVQRFYSRKAILRRD
ncbi:hypothetical protein BKA59DRAFT_458736 [Fusarium tricinctum]|uniref:Uncharacterized protein n=1 Tax=Fusarium tricinctum TaxID=61284 RepID=A0A8K0W9Q9_9HYPO|nr:hypothetical protein BKA59DRAFT_458736 [Fusarium tricinctum]